MVLLHIKNHYMTIRKIYRTFLSALLAIIVLLGTTGFHIETHECVHCGIDHRIILFDMDESVNDDCCSETSSKSCCSSESHDKEADNKTDQCSFIPGSCCEYTSESIKLTGFLISEKAKINFDSSIINSFAYIASPALQKTLHDFRVLHNKHGGSEIIKINCQYLT